MSDYKLENKDYLLFQIWCEWYLDFNNAAHIPTIKTMCIVFILKINIWSRWNEEISHASCIVLCLIFMSQIVLYLCQVQCSAIIMQAIFSKFSWKTHHRSPVRTRYGVSFVDSISDLHTGPVTIVMYAISCYVGPHCNSNELYYCTLLFHRLVLTLSIHHIICQKIPIFTRDIYVPYFCPSPPCCFLKLWFYETLLRTLLCQSCWYERNMNTDERKYIASHPTSKLFIKAKLVGTCQHAADLSVRQVIWYLVICPGWPGQKLRWRLLGTRDTRRALAVFTTLVGCSAQRVLTNVCVIASHISIAYRTFICSNVWGNRIISIAVLL